MGDLLPFKKPRASKKHQGKTLCRHGHHKWQLEKETVFDVKQGKLVSRYTCFRCGTRKIRPT
ncbi:MAG: hypothetical protein GY696_40885 [Gammaproteobacteria bacterium]|nr:hypothetical protein [Gammaproteobacteria bacterium]